MGLLLEDFAMSRLAARSCASIFPIALTVVAIFAFSAAAEAMANNSNSNTVIGSNMLLVEGASALNGGDWKRGIQLTELGLATVVSQDDKATALANLCAGYAAIKEYSKALLHCNESIELDRFNWRTWQNRAACHLGLGRVEESLADVQRGLSLNPNAESLQQTLAIIRQYEKSQQERLQQLLES